VQAAQNRSKVVEHTRLAIMGGNNSIHISSLPCEKLLVPLLNVRNSTGFNAILYQHTYTKMNTNDNYHMRDAWIMMNIRNLRHSLQNHRSSISITVEPMKSSPIPSQSIHVISNRLSPGIVTGISMAS
jgi:hypothetical protein